MKTTEIFGQSLSLGQKIGIFSACMQVSEECHARALEYKKGGNIHNFMTMAQQAQIAASVAATWSDAIFNEQEKH